MIFYLRYGGAALVMLGALLVSRAYASYMKKRLSEYRGLERMIAHAEGEISCFLAYGSELWRNFSDEAMEGCGLLSHLRDGKGISESFELSRDAMSLSASAKQKISDMLEPLGRGYKDDEVKLLSSIGDRLSEEISRESDEAEKNIRIARALLIGGALAVVIMIV